MAFISYFIENPVMLGVVACFVALMAGLGWGQFQTWRFDNDIEARTGKRPY
ncbi:hypothetical protein [Devosia epidermidihirudinis]|uniref:hypothetical protein n=1 Tax=Devosia epidermidihirudinis TaxID=1293439 RepID=UPI000B190ECC|nr:hypothetical protein [Devosia epidermidihirudinis]